MTGDFYTAHQPRSPLSAPPPGHPIPHYGTTIVGHSPAAPPTAETAGNLGRYTFQVKKVFTRFLLSATAPGQFPRPLAPEIAFLGRSNVGKSSLINALLGEQQARVSSTPGRTRAINFFALTDAPERQQAQLVFADLPGYGYAKISKSVSAEWPKFIEPYLRDREPLALCVCLVDSTIPPRASDAQLLEFLAAAERNFLVVGTKADRLSGNGRAQALRALREVFGAEHLLLVSAKTGAGVRDLWAAIQEAAGVALR